MNQGPFHKTKALVQAVSEEWARRVPHASGECMDEHMRQMEKTFGVQLRYKALYRRPYETKAGVRVGVSGLTACEVEYREGEWSQTPAWGREVGHHLFAFDTWESTEATRYVSGSEVLIYLAMVQGPHPLPEHNFFCGFTGLYEWVHKRRQLPDSVSDPKSFKAFQQVLKEADAGDFWDPGASCWEQILPVLPIQEKVG